MTVDFVFPRDNEDQFVEMAQHLGYAGVCFVYSYGSTKKYSPVNSSIRVASAVLARPEHVGKAKNKKASILVQSPNDVRGIVEKNNNLILYEIENTGKKDFVHHRSSGLNQVICKPRAG